MQIGLAFSTIPANVDERVLHGERPEAYAVRVARDKALVAARHAGRSIIIAADTIVVLDDKILGKPADRNDAIRMLKLLSGAVHEVITGLCVLDTDTRKTLIRTVTTKVWFRRLTAEEITVYVDSREPLDKAGAYGIQGKGALFVDRIEGCYFNIVGLPLSVLSECLEAFHVVLW